jgi:HEAT repeat protein
MGAESAREPLRRALEDSEGSVRMRAAVALALLGDGEAQAILRRALPAGEGRPASAGNGIDRPSSGGDRVLKMNNPAERDYVRIVAAEALARLGDSEARAFLVRMLRHPRRFLALFAAESLSNLGDSAPRQFLLDVVGDSGDRAHRMYAAWTLARLGDGTGGPAVAELLTHPDEHLRQRAAWTLGQMGRLGPIAPLRGALRDPDRGVRYQAAWALGEVVLAGPPPRESGKS